MIPFWNQKDFIAFGKTADGPFGFIDIVKIAGKNGREIYMLHYKEIEIYPNQAIPMIITTVKLEKFSKQRIKMVTEVVEW